MDGISLMIEIIEDMNAKFAIVDKATYASIDAFNELRDTLDDVQGKFDAFSVDSFVESIEKAFGNVAEVENPLEEELSKYTPFIPIESTWLDTPEASAWAALEAAADDAERLANAFGKLEKINGSDLGTKVTSFTSAFDSVSGISDQMNNIMDFADNLGKIVDFDADWMGEIGKALGSNTSLIGLGIGAIALLIDYINSLPSATEILGGKLVELNIATDREINDRIRAAIEEAWKQEEYTWDADARTPGSEESIRSASAVQAVKSGYGTAGIYGEALGYTSTMFEAQIDAETQKYLELIAEQEAIILDAMNGGEGDAMKAYEEVAKLELEKQERLQGMRGDYAQEMSDLFNGMLDTYSKEIAALEMAGGVVPEDTLNLVETMEKTVKQYDLMVAIWEHNTMDRDLVDVDAFLAERARIYEELEKQEFIDEKNLSHYLEYPLDGNFDDFLDQVEGKIGETLTLLGEHPEAASFLQPMIQAMAEFDGFMENFDFSALNGGAMEGMIKALDFKAAMEMALMNGDIEQYGLYLVEGLGRGMLDNVHLIDFVALRDSVLSMLAGIFGIHSPSRVMAEQGVFLTEGLAVGIQEGSPYLATEITNLSNSTMAALEAALTYADAYSIGTRLPEGLAAGISAKTELVEEAARRLAKAALLASRMELLINSPSRAYEELGLFAGEGFALGLMRRYEMAEEAARNLVEVQNMHWVKELNMPEISDEDLKLLWELAERETVNKFTTAEIRIDMGGVTNQVNSDVDVDRLMKVMGRKLMEQVQCGAKGLHL